MFLRSPLFWAFVGVPLLEIMLFLQVGQRIGFWATLGVVLVTAAAGTSLVRQQGLAVLRRAQENMNRGVMPAAELVDGLLIVVAGLLLLTPGFFTDAAGFTLLLPAARAGARRLLMKRFGARLGAGTVGTGWPGGPGPHGRPRASEVEIIDTSAEVVDREVER